MDESVKKYNGHDKSPVGQAVESHFALSSLKISRFKVPHHPPVLSTAQPLQQLFSK